MSNPEDAPAEHITIIVRRGHAEEEGHHGGVWKIAYADFMTAMMAFFLVMWLVNASNTEMKASVASYFNPIKLSDNVIRKKGLRDVDGKANADEESKAEKSKSSGKSDGKAKDGKAKDGKAKDGKAKDGKAKDGKAKDGKAKDGKAKDGKDKDGKAKAESLPLQPGEAVKLGADENPGAAPEPTDSPFGRDGNATKGGRASDSGRAFRDPFNPFAPGQLMTQEGAGKETTRGATPGTPGAQRDAAPLSPTAMLEAGKLIEELRRGGPGSELRDRQTAGPAQKAGVEPPTAPGGASREQARAGDTPAGAAKAGDAKVGEHKTGEVKAGDARSGEAKVGETKAGETKPGDDKAGPAPDKAQLEAAASGVLRDIRDAVKPIAGDGGPGIEVTVEDNGIVLSLTDTSTFGMFAIGSSEPSRQTIELINRIAPVLAANSKRIIVRGHTDSRVFRTGNNNNWRLSVSRAEAAYAMLVRSGIDEARFNRIEGYADRKLKDPKDPEAATNRRIEILLQQVAE